MTNLKRFFLTLSGENIKLSRFEIISLFNLKKTKINEIRLFDRLLIITCERNISKFIAQRAALTHNISELLIECSIDEKNIINSFKNIDINEFVKNKNSFAVRIQKIGHRSINSEYFEKLIGKVIKNQLEKKIKANLKNPEILFFGVFVQDKFFFGINYEMKIRRKIKEKSLKFRPFFHPAALNPRIARAMVNLSRVKEDGIFLDPFCGTGSILIEALLIGCRKVIGIDINQKMINGTKLNLKKFNLNKYNLILSDSNHIPLKKVTNIATDPPYGRSSSTHKKSLMLLLENFFSEINDLILKNKIITLALPSHINLSNLIDKTKLRILKEFEHYVHSSLTRKIYVIQRK
ncbi:MAG: DNA methyltransferase [Candidatus Helarchaeota archaeon]